MQFKRLAPGGSREHTAVTWLTGRRGQNQPAGRKGRSEAGAEPGRVRPQPAWTHTWPPLSAHLLLNTNYPARSANTSREEDEMCGWKRGRWDVEWWWRGRGEREIEKVLVELAIKRGDVKRKRQEMLKQRKFQVNMKQHLQPILLRSCFWVKRPIHTEMWRLTLSLPSAA